MKIIKNTHKFISCILVLHLLMASPVLMAAPVVAENTLYLESALEHIDEEHVKASNVYEQTLMLDKLYQWLLLLLKADLTDEQFYDLLKQAQPTVKHIAAFGNDMAQFLYPNFTFETLDVTLNGKATKAYLNMLSDRYDQELESYNKHRVISSHLLTGESLRSLKPYVTYGYVVTLAGDLYFSELQDFDWLMDGNVKILLAPNHPVLAGGYPILAAGELIVLGDEHKKIYQVGTTSGHYRPDYSSHVHVVDILVSLGVKSEQIVPTVFLIHRIPWKFVVKSNLKQKEVR